MIWANDMSEAVRQVLSVIEAEGGRIRPGDLERKLRSLGLLPRDINRAVQYAYENGFVELDAKNFKRTEIALEAA